MVPDGQKVQTGRMDDAKTMNNADRREYSQHIHQIFVQRQLFCKGLVRPQVEYASPVWSPNTKHNINKIEMTQRRAARRVKNQFSPYESVTNMLSELGWRSRVLKRTLKTGLIESIPGKRSSQN